MKKKLGLLICIIVLITLSGCKKDISSKELVNKWETTVNKTSDILIEQKKLDIKNKKSVSSLINSIDKHKKNIKQESTSLNNSKAIKTTEGKELDEIYSLNISTLDVIKKEIKQQKISDKENEAPGLLGKKTAEFANKYNNGNLPGSLEKFINLENENDNEAQYEDSSTTSSEDNSQTLPELSSEPSTTFEENGIDKIYTKTPDSSQEAILDELTNTSFSEKYPYKGSKMNNILGVIQPWTSTDNKTWYKKVEAVIVNEFGAKRNVNLEIHVTPTGSNTGVVDFIDY